MKAPRRTLLVILLSYSVLIQNYKPVSGGLITITTTLGSGFFLIPKLKTAWKQTGYFFGTIGYICYVKMSTYEKFTGSDDIIQDKYVNLDLASTNHGRFITITEQPDDTLNGRTNLKLYEVKYHDHPQYTKHLTIGRVNFYKRRLQGNLKYEYRTVLTYKDERGKNCIQIDSFNSSGNRIMKRIYRERNFWWWYDLIIDEKESLIHGLKAMNVLNLASQATYKLDLIRSDVPQCMTKLDFAHGNLYMMKKGANLKQLTEIIFANEPFKVSSNASDLLVWHYFKNNEKSTTSFVVICEFIKNVWFCKYHKCLSHADNQYKAYNSFYVPLDNISFGEGGTQTKSVNKIQLKFDLKTNEVPDEINKYELHLYPESNHYVLRPKNLATVDMIDSVQANDPNVNANLQHPVGDSFRFVSIKKYGEIYLLSYTALNSHNLVFNTITMKKTTNSMREVFYESNTRALLESMLSPYYMGLSVLGKSVNADFLDLDVNKKEGILTAKFNDNVTFYSSLNSQYRVLRKLNLQSQSFDVDHDVNSQVFYCEVDNAKFALISYSKGEHKIIKSDGGPFKVTPTNTVQDLLSRVHLTEILELKLDEKWENVSLDINCVYISEDVEVMVPTYNTVIFKTPFGKRISEIILTSSKITIKEGWPLVTRVKYLDHNLLLIDTVLKDKVNRELYRMGPEDDTTLLSNISISLSNKNLDNIAKELSDSLHDLYPNTLGVNVFFEDAKTDISEFTIDNMKIAHSNSDLILSPGDITAHEQNYKTLDNHKWEQVFKYQGTDGTDFYKIFILDRKEMSYYSCSDKDKTTKKFQRESFQTISDKSVPLLVESINSEGVTVEVIKIGNKDLLKFKAPDNKILNPIIFGKHEIKLLGDFKKVEVVKSVSDDQKSSISIEALLNNKERKSLTFTQINPNSERYNVVEGGSIPFEDSSLDIFEMIKDQENQQVVDFNQSKYPLDLRYMILNDNYFYFTGYTKTDKLDIKFGDETHKVQGPDSRFNIWVRYPYENVTSCAFLMSYTEGTKLKTVSQVHDNHDSQYKVSKPPVNFNWGILSNVEALVVNRNILCMVAHKEDFFPIDLKIDDSTSNKVIMKLKIDENAHVYTTVSSSKCVINNVRFKNAVIKGVPKQIGKQVFHSKDKGENVIVVATKTISKVLVNAYILKEDTFEMVELKDIKCSKHEALKGFGMCS